MRVITHSAADVRALRRALRLTQKQFAAELGVARRTVIRGEQRGLEIPWYSSSDFRHVLHAAWDSLQKRAADAARALKAASSRSDTSAIAKVSPAPTARIQRWSELAKLLRAGWRVDGFDVVSKDGERRSVWGNAIAACRARGLVGSGSAAKGPAAAGGDTKRRQRRGEPRGWR